MFPRVPREYPRVLLGLYPPRGYPGFCAECSNISIEFWLQTVLVAPETPPSVKKRLLSSPHFREQILKKHMYVCVFICTRRRMQFDSFPH